jgi:hypothetical protein
VGFQVVVVAVVLCTGFVFYFIFGVKSLQWIGGKYLFNRRHISHHMRAIQTPFERVGLSIDDDDPTLNRTATKRTLAPAASLATVAPEYERALDESVQKGLACLYKYFKARNSRNLRKIGDDAPTLYTEVANCCADPQTRELCVEYGQTLLKELVS